MNKSRCTALVIGMLLVNFITLKAEQDWQLWINTGISGKPNPFIKTSLEQEFRLQNNLQEFYYAHVDPTVLAKFQAKKEDYVGFQGRYIFQKSSTSPQWNWEFQPSIMLNLDTSLGSLESNTVLKFIYRTGPTIPLHAGIRFQPGITLFKNKSFSIYATNEFFYNYDNYQQYDKNRVIIGMKGNLVGPLQAGIYYLHDSEKKGPGKRWIGIHALGIIFRAII